MYNAINTNFLLHIEVDEMDESTLQRALAIRITEMLSMEADLLFSTLYRLDVLEYKIKDVLAGATDEDIATGLARLVIDRQKEKLKTKKPSGKPPQFNDF